jgi:hypothetical protein
MSNIAIYILIMLLMAYLVYKFKHLFLPTDVYRNEKETMVKFAHEVIFNPHYAPTTLDRSTYLLTRTLFGYNYSTVLNFKIFNSSTWSDEIKDPRALGFIINEIDFIMKLGAIDNITDLILFAEEHNLDSKWTTN